MCVLQSTGVDKLAVAGLASAAECVLPVAQVWLLVQCQTVTNCLCDAQALTPSGCRVRSPFGDMPAIHEYVLSAIFLVDMILKFRLAYRKDEQLIGDPSTIRTRYLRCEMRERHPLGLQAEVSTLQTERHAWLPQHCRLDPHVACPALTP